MRLFLTFSKKSLAATLAAIILALLTAGQLFSLRAAGPDGSTNALRLEYAQRLGYAVEETPTDIREIIIPQTFSDVYTRYNALQRQAGFDLTVYKGKPATVYAYLLKEDPDMRVNLIVCGDRIIGGDVSSVRLDGDMLPLCSREDTEQKEIHRLF